MAAVEGEIPSMPYATEPSDGVGVVFNADDNGVMSVGGSDSMAPTETSGPAMGSAEDGMVFAGGTPFFNEATGESSYQIIGGDVEYPSDPNFKDPLGPIEAQSDVKMEIQTMAPSRSAGGNESSIEPTERMGRGEFVQGTESSNESHQFGVIGGGEDYPSDPNFRDPIGPIEAQVSSRSSFGGAREFFNRQDDSSIEMGDSSQASSDVHEARPHRHEHFHHGFGGHHHGPPVDSGIFPNAEEVSQQENLPADEDYSASRNSDDGSNGWGAA